MRCGTAPKSFEPGGISFAHYDSGVPAVAEVPALAHTTFGDLRGTVEGGVAVWRGVPYAQQPVGQRRFAAPEPLLPWTGVRDAVEHAPLPLQSRSMVAGDRNDPKIRDEACLSVTVWSPDVSGSLPVMVWIPGGAFLNGAGQLQLYNGSRLAANGNVVVVNVTYRVGVFGGFELGDLGAGFENNLCLRDQIAALAWVRDNIAAFGGDADRVTVFGESAGATSVLALLASPAADGLFARAIAQSPALPLIADRATRGEQAQRFLSRLGIGAGELQALKDLPQRELRRAAGELQLAEHRDDADAGAWAHLRGGSAAAASARGGAGRRGGPGPVDHRYQPGRGVDVCPGQAADAADDTGQHRRLFQPAGAAGAGAGAGRLPWLPAPARAGGHWC